MTAFLVFNYIAIVVALLNTNRLQLNNDISSRISHWVEHGASATEMIPIFVATGWNFIFAISLRINHNTRTSTAFKCHGQTKRFHVARSDNCTVYSHEFATEISAQILKRSYEIKVEEPRAYVRNRFNVEHSHRTATSLGIRLLKLYIFYDDLEWGNKIFSYV